MATERQTTLLVKLTEQEKQILTKAASLGGHSGVSSYMRVVALVDAKKQEVCE
jgi:uncharacterized protein (DUF1778 family)